MRIKRKARSELCVEENFLEKKIILKKKEKNILKQNGLINEVMDACYQKYLKRN